MLFYIVVPWRRNTSGSFKKNNDNKNFFDKTLYICTVNIFHQKKLKMHFIVKFIAHDGYAIDIKSTPIAGLNFLDEMRTKTKMLLPVTKMKLSYIPELRTDLELSMSEEQAREIGGPFKSSFSCKVMVSTGFFNQCTDIYIENDSPDETWSVRRKIDNEKVLNLWRENGYSMELKPIILEASE